MSTGQTLLTICAFVLLSNILITFYRLLAESGQTVDGSQSAITMVSLATSFTQYIQGLRFDELTIDSLITEPSYLTLPLSLGLDNQYGRDYPNDITIPRENQNQPRYFDDVDDFHGKTIRDTTLGGTLGIYAARFRVSYVNPDNAGQISATQTFVKRVDVMIWREDLASADTVYYSAVIGYWMFSGGS